MARSVGGTLLKQDCLTSISNYIGTAFQIAALLYPLIVTLTRVLTQDFNSFVSPVIIFSNVYL